MNEEHKLEIRERESRIRELEAKSKPQIDVNPPDILKPDDLTNLHDFFTGTQGYVHRS